MTDLRKYCDGYSDFDLEKARNGKPVRTLQGSRVRIICFDRKNVEYPIVGLIAHDEDDTEELLEYTKEGWTFADHRKCCDDLVMDER